MACIFIYTRNIRVIVHISIPYSEFKLTLLINTPYIPYFHSFLSCGTKSHTILSVQEPWIKRWSNRSAWIAWTRGRTRALKEGVITVVIETYAMHLNLQIAIQGARSDAFYNASQHISFERFITDRTAATCLKRFMMDRSIVTID